MTHEHWKHEPDEHDYPAADSYLSLLGTPKEAAAWSAALRAASTTTYKAKDLLRASGLDLLPTDDEHVAQDLHKVKKGERLSPVLLVRGDLRSGRALAVADGYHRICASYHLEEDEDIPCRVVDLMPTAP